jgi:hypothetical protein
MAPFKWPLTIQHKEIEYQNAPLVGICCVLRRCNLLLHKRGVDLYLLVSDSSVAEAAGRGFGSSVAL